MRANAGVAGVAGVAQVEPIQKPPDGSKQRDSVPEEQEYTGPLLAIFVCFAFELVASPTC